MGHYKFDLDFPEGEFAERLVRDLLLDIRRTFSDRDDLTEADILDRVLSVQLLLLDDVGVDPPQPVARGNLLDIVWPPTRLAAAGYRNY